MFEQFFSYHLEGWSTPSGILSLGQVGIRDHHSPIEVVDLWPRLDTADAVSYVAYCDMIKDGIMSFVPTPA